METYNNIRFFGKINDSKCKYIASRTNINSDELSLEIKNSKMHLRQFSKPEYISFVSQVHGKNVKEVTSKNINLEIIADGQVSKDPSVSLAIITADCLPIMLFDQKNKIIGAAHAGWRGAKLGIIESTIESMINLGATEIKAIIGPSIKQKNYEVGEEFFLDFISESESNKKYFIKSNKDNHYMFDLPSYGKDKLTSLNISDVTISDIDTYSNNEYFSYRRCSHNNEIYYGSNVSIIKNS